MSKETLIEWLIKNEVKYVPKGSTHTGFYSHRNKDFIISYYNIDNRVWITLNKDLPGVGGWIYTNDADRIKNIFKSIFGFND